MHKHADDLTPAMTGRATVVASVVILFVAVMAYANTLDVPFLFDDERNVSENPAIRIESLSMDSLWKAATGGPTARPLAYFSFALNYYFGETDVWGYHLTNLLIHAAVGCVVFQLSRLLLLQMDLARTPFALFGISLSAALLFVVHPVQTQSVTYIVQRMASLCALFYLSALTAYCHGRQAEVHRVRWSWWCLGILLWLLALATKPNAVTLPLAVVLVEWIGYRRGEVGWLRRVWPSLLGAVVVMGVAVFVFCGFQLPTLFERGFAQRDFTMWGRLLTQGRVIGHYVSLVAWPFPSRLTLLYDFPISRGLFDPATTVFAWGALLAATVWAAKGAARHRLISFAILWFLLHLVVESSILPLELIYEHRLYLPLFGVCLAVSVGIFRLFAQPKIAMLVMVLLVSVLGWATHARNEIWRDALGFWLDNNSKQPSDDRVAFNLAMTYANQQQFDQAQRWLDRAIELNPNSQVAYHRRALTHEIQGDFAAALADYDAAIAVPAELRRGPFSVSDSFLRRGRIHLRNERFADAAADFEQAIQLSPGRAQGYLDRATVNVYLNRPKAVIEDFVMATRVEPKRVEAHDKLAWYLATYPDDRVAMPGLAVQHATTACELSNWTAYSPLATLAAAYARQGDFGKAVHWQQQSLQLAPPSRQPALRGRLSLYEQSQPMLERYATPR